MDKQHLKYMPHIDGLRAVAVLSVIFYHLNMSAFNGGFVGVDIFFVISGYLISKIIYVEIDNQSFSLSTFYKRRARRILPAFMAAVMFSALLSAIFMYSQELASFAKSAFAASVFSANIYYFLTSSYFSSMATEMPLLHLWSLGIEEQFYIFFPLLTIALTKFNKTTLPVGIISILLISVILSQWMLMHNPPAAFYLLPFRAFELLVGCTIAIPREARAKSPFRDNLTLLLGIAIIIFCVCTYSAGTSFPGFNALLPCLGTAIVLMAGGERPFLSTVILENAVIRHIGKLSYSMYLFHWPLIVFGKRLFPNAEKLEFNLIVFVATYFLAALCFRFIENRFRGPEKKNSSVRVYGYSLASLISVMAISGLTIYNNGFTKSPDERVAKAMSYIQYDPTAAFRTGECFFEARHIHSGIDFTPCLPKGHLKKAMIWGDSHAAQYYFGLKPLLEQQGYSLALISASACPPIENIVVKANPNCTEFNAQAYPEIISYQPDLLILGANWVVNKETMDLFEATLQKLNKTGTKLVILGESPLYRRKVPVIFSEHVKSGEKMYSSKDLEQEFLDNSEKIMSQRFSGRSDVTYVPIMKILCPNGQCPLAADDGSPAQFDIAHLTDSGSKTFSKMILPAILGGHSER